MKNLLFCLFYLISPLCLALSADSSDSAPFVFTAHIQDFYIWSKDKAQYRLQKSRFRVQLVDKDGQTVVQDEVLETVKASNAPRYLLVQPKQVSFTHLKKRNTVRATLSENQKSLVIHFSQRAKESILNGLLPLVNGSETIKILLSAEKKPKGLVSDYSCHIQARQGVQLLCVMSYSFDKLTMASSSDEDKLNIASSSDKLIDSVH